MDNFERDMTIMMKTPIGNGNAVKRVVNQNDPFDVEGMMTVTIGGDCDGYVDVSLHEKRGEFICQP